MRARLPVADRRDALPVAIGGPKTKKQPRMAEVVLSQRRCVSCQSAFCGPACPGTGGHLWWWNHGHICGLSSLQDGVEGYRPFGAGQVGIKLDMAWGCAALIIWASLIPLISVILTQQ